MKIGYYVSDRQQMRKYISDSHDKRKWVGLSVVLDCLSRRGIEAAPVGRAGVRDVDAVLVSVTSAMDLWQFAAERQTWPEGKYRVIVGGYGALNIRPFLHLADAFVFGRAEGFAADLVETVALGGHFEHESVAMTKDFSPEKSYVISQARCAYPEEVRLSDGSRWRELVVGCQGRCLFCGYTWQRRHNGVLHQESMKGGSSIWASDVIEKTMLSLDMSNPVSWESDGSLRIIGLDGFSEKLRRSVNKPITKDRLIGFLSGLQHLGEAHYVKLYNIVGLPGETKDDWEEFKSCLSQADALMPSLAKKWNIILHCTPFKAFPCTPMACASMPIQDYRNKIPRDLIMGGPYKGSVFFEGKGLWAKADWGIDGPATQVLWAIAFRGDERDQKAVSLVSGSKKFWDADGPTKLATLRRYFDVDRLLGEQDKKTIATKFLRSWWNNKGDT